MTTRLTALDQILLQLTSLFPRTFAPTARKRLASSRLSLATEAGRNCEQRLLVDVSIIAQQNAGTGIQRVVLAILGQLLIDPPHGWTVEAIYATRKSPYRYANDFVSRTFGIDASSEDTLVKVHRGDLFLGLDMASRILSRRKRDLALWQKQGVCFVFIVYDLLPALHPDWFTQRARKAFAQWLTTLAIHATALLCISNSAADETRNWFLTHYKLDSADLPISWFHLGADFEGGATQNEASATNNCVATTVQPTLLMVGTVEPRKGYEQAIAAMELLWSQGNDVKLVIVGKRGWNVDDLVARIERHPELNNRLLWFPDTTDQQLINLYQQATGVVMASNGEGFGLPLIEAAKFGVPVLARDIKVFREIAGDNVSYFSGTTASNLAAPLQSWLLEMIAGKAPDIRELHWLTWAESATHLKRKLVSLRA
ncbi:glycosyltransferase family 4 protein [Paraburkholderia sprentiae WSM5005]|uniref:Glycosyltransferase family 4 protein n=1 Tax=Paraburkholderia sprentiae WSM5005 TaxID=754502 RepID=A0A1I9YRV1_9BURK|nr:glycosyltransferase family 1 protein [Paraburkholderia sprentiae]APA88936.1 glycosyltransferase family 4 protein [Paraburkholderia sprentiae WSM5005]